MMDVILVCNGCGAKDVRPLGTGFSLDCTCEDPYLIPKAVDLSNGNRVVGWGSEEEREEGLDAGDVELLVEYVLGDAEAERFCSDCGSFHKIPTCDGEYGLPIALIEEDADLQQGGVNR